MASEKCQTCSSERLAKVSYKTRSVEYEVWETDGVGIPFIPGEAGISDIYFTYCLDCGQIQGHWPAENLDDTIEEWRKIREEEEEARRPMTEEEVAQLLERPKGRSHGELNVIINRLDAEIYEGDLDETTKTMKIKEREAAEQELFGSGDPS